MNDEIILENEQEQELQVSLLSDEDFTVGAWAAAGMVAVGSASFVGLGIAVIIAILKRGT